MSWRVLPLAALVVSLPAAAYLWEQGRLRLEPDPRRHPLKGVDLSHHQGAVDWGALGAGELSFAYLKASEGGAHRDKRFAENALGAADASIPAGAYHFFTFCRDGLSQADNYLGAVRGAPLVLPPAVDLEFGGNCARRPSIEELRADLRAFAERVERRTGRRLVYYVTGDFLREYGPSLPRDARVWIRSIFLPADLAYGPGWTFWQYTGRARVRGIRGPVDLNVFRGSREDWAAFIAPAPRDARARR